MKVTRKVTLPPESDCGAGSTALASVLDTCTAPEKLETRLFEASSACTETLRALPDTTEADAGDTEKCVADAAGGGAFEPEPGGGGAFEPEPGGGGASEPEPPDELD